MSISSYTNGDRGAPWLSSQGAVTSCRFQFARVNLFTLGFETGDKFRIGFTYYAHGREYSGEFQSPIAIAQGETIPLTYNPLHPEQNSRTSGPTGSSGRSPLIAIGVGGSIVLSLLWLSILRGCG